MIQHLCVLRTRWKGSAPPIYCTACVWARNNVGQVENFGSLTQPKCNFLKFSAGRCHECRQTSHPMHRDPSCRDIRSAPRLRTGKTRKRPRRILQRLPVFLLISRRPQNPVRQHTSSRWVPFMKSSWSGRLSHPHSTCMQGSCHPLPANLPRSRTRPTQQPQVIGRRALSGIWIICPF